ncbi:TetR/AcrR family transcriptional regulator [Delftia sp. WSY_4]|uniref:TetR/AcrR family transcriptional regulator n=1 Tax=unclassified Delftia TaxID=2613839 RepID=UPI00370AB4A5
MPSQKKPADSAPKKPRRNSGRPLADDAVGRDIILQTTVNLLKTRTPEQLSILEIAAAAGVTRALVRYYFSSLKGLLQEVTESLMRELQNRMEVALRTQGTVEERVYQRLLLRLDFMREHPQFERLALSEIYHYESEEEPPPSGTPLQRITRRGLELTSTMLMDGAQASHPAQVDPRFIHLAILSISAFLPTARPLLAELFGEGPQADQQVEHYLHFMSHLLAERIRQDAPAQDHPPHPGHHPD